MRWLKELADDVHEKGAAVMIQITHLGRRTSWSKDDWLPVIAPSPVREPAHRAFPKAMEDWDFARVIGAYADAAERVKAGGLDGLEFECYGHLIDQFWSPATNKRDGRIWRDRSTIASGSEWPCSRRCGGASARISFLERGSSATRTGSGA